MSWQVTIRCEKCSGTITITGVVTGRAEVGQHTFFHTLDLMREHEVRLHGGKGD